MEGVLSHNKGYCFLPHGAWADSSLDLGSAQHVCAEGKHGMPGAKWMLNG